jgi:hypothetical protein
MRLGHMVMPNWKKLCVAAFNNRQKDGWQAERKRDWRTRIFMNLWLLLAAK